MHVYLLRHGRTAWTEQHRYQGRRDIPLSPEGEAELRQADFRPEAVWVSPLSRARRTAELSAHEVVISTEVGGGVVPTDPAERAAREAAGRLNCLLAKRADRVIRVFCGLPMVLKGAL